MTDEPAASRLSRIAPIYADELELRIIPLRHELRVFHRAGHAPRAEDIYEADFTVQNRGVEGLAFFKVFQRKFGEGFFN